MSVLLYIVGTIAAVLGLVLVAAGIPVKEFSFGNTLIISGVVAISGGLVVFALGAVLAQLTRVAEMLGSRPSASLRTAEPFDAAAGRAMPMPSRVPFPPKPKAAVEPAPDAPGVDAMLPPISEPPSAPSFDTAAASPEPSLPNPADPHYADTADEAPLTPRQMPPFGTRPATSEPKAFEPKAFEPKAFEPRAFEPKPFEPKSFEPKPLEPKPPEPRSFSEPRDPASLGVGWRPAAPPVPPRPPQPGYFDTWKQGERDPAMSESIARAPSMPEVPRFDAAEPQAPAPVASDFRAVPILKSGVIDGMGYTLFVDGSIEAELPTGTLRFASISELRDHLEKSA